MGVQPMGGIIARGNRRINKTILAISNTSTEFCPVPEKGL